MTPATRATFRTVGQLALLISIAAGLESHYQHLVRCLRDDASSRMICTWPFAPNILPITLLGYGCTALAALGFFATLRPSRARIAQACALLLAAPGPIWLSWRSLTGHWGTPWWTWMTTVAGVVPMVLLLLSYPRSPIPLSPVHATHTLNLVDQTRGIDWLRDVLAPLVVLTFLARHVEEVLELPLLVQLVQAVSAGVLYREMRARRPSPGTGRWVPATLILTALLVPEYTWLRWASPITDMITPSQITRDAIAWALALTAVAALAVAQLISTHRTRRERTAPTRPADEPAGPRG